MLVGGPKECCTVVGSDIPNPHAVLDQPLVDGLGGMGHENASSEIGLCHDIGQACGVIQMEMANQ